MILYFSLSFRICNPKALNICICNANIKCKNDKYYSSRQLVGCLFYFLSAHFDRLSVLQ